MENILTYSDYINENYGNGNSTYYHQVEILFEGFDPTILTVKLSYGHTPTEKEITERVNERLRVFPTSFTIKY